MSTVETATTAYTTLPNSNVRMAYRRLQPTNIDLEVLPLVMHIHFRANMDFWDPALINPIAAKRPVILFDQPGVGRSGGEVATSYQGWANNVIALCDALGLTKIDLVGFSMGGYTVQMVALTRPELIHKLIIFGSGPSVPFETHGIDGIVWPRDYPPAVPINMLASAEAGSAREVENAIAISFFPHSSEGQKACTKYFERLQPRNNIDGEELILSFLGAEQTKQQWKAAAQWQRPDPQNSFHRLGELKMPVLVLNGDDDLLIPTSRSWELLKRIENCQLIIYPKAGHGFCWQYADRVARDVNTFLDETLA